MLETVEFNTVSTSDNVSSLADAVTSSWTSCYKSGTPTHWKGKRKFLKKKR